MLICFTMLLCCSNDDLETSDADYSSFLNEETPIFKGKIDSQNFNWKFGYDFQMSHGFENGNRVCDPADQVRVLTFGLLAENQSARFNFLIPKMNISNQSEVEDIFSIGTKNFGGVFEYFYINVFINDFYYVSKSSNTLKILKTKSYTNYDGTEHLKSWIITDDLVLENCNDENDKIVITNGLMIADFYGYRTE